MGLMLSETHLISMIHHPSVQIISRMISYIIFVCFHFYVIIKCTVVVNVDVVDVVVVVVVIVIGWQKRIAIQKYNF